ncbi:AAA family ATPase [Corallococcus interemptor]|uniref:AAA family ATPase n=1 Tax=Corallococcus TaxID=83461 RepID=UPI001CC07084|nr:MULTISPECIES: ATP-binding protein [unclassified Corallococcus]MBZ4333247.1 AAA family ATPase [Corallococcus sp. AS-1-12]MBZ4373409.1 AAA family ATPase [Corallococcus sp. AS-1-6]
MLERLYVDNYRCFVNFEWKPDRLALLLGENGSGKTSVLDVLWSVRSLVVRDREVRGCFPHESRTRWESRLNQRVELDVRLGQDLYKYRLQVDHDEEEPSNTRVGFESLHCNETSLLEFVNGQLTIRGSKGAPDVTFSARTGSSGLSALGTGAKKLAVFKRWLDEDVWYFRPDPRRMSGRTDAQRDMLEESLHNLASWYPPLITHELMDAIRIQDALREVIPGFEALAVDKTRPQLQVRFSAGKGAPYSVDFVELSDGQRALIALYILRHTVIKPGRLIIFDEPDNYVALREIQPWLLDVVDAASEEDGPQVFFVSHHPEFLNQLAPSNGTRFFRQAGGPSRIEPFQGLPGLNSAEVVARGWEDTTEPPHE